MFSSGHCNLTLLGSLTFAKKTNICYFLIRLIHCSIDKMGCTISNYEDKESALRSKEIDRKLKQDRENKTKEIKLLLLGTFVKFTSQLTFVI